jgi:hypothetical protein
METISGKANNIRSSVDVSGGNYGIFVNTAQVTLFSIDDYPVMMVNKRPPVIQEGNEVVVSGHTKNGRLNAYAYHNITTSSKGDRGYIRYLLAAFILSLLALYLWYIYGNALGYGIKIASGFFLLFGVFYLNKGINILKAVKNIEMTLP